MSSRRKRYRKRYLPAFLRMEGLLGQVEAGVLEICGEESLEMWKFLGTVEVIQARLRQRYGRACYDTRRIWVSTAKRNQSPKVRRDTILHEVAHLVTWHHYQIPHHHGRDWRRVARALGAQPRA